jgi:hypothetical protein
VHAVGEYFEEESPLESHLLVLPFLARNAETGSVIAGFDFIEAAFHLNTFDTIGRLHRGW